MNICLICFSVQNYQFLADFNEYFFLQKKIDELLFIFFCQSNNALANAYLCTFLCSFQYHAHDIYIYSYMNKYEQKKIILFLNNTYTHIHTRKFIEMSNLHLICIR